MVYALKNLRNAVDYVILISFMMKLLKCAKKKNLAFIRLFEKNCEELREKVSTFEGSIA